MTYGNIRNIATEELKT